MRLWILVVMERFIIIIMIFSEFYKYIFNQLIFLVDLVYYFLCQSYVCGLDWESLYKL